MNRRNFLKRGLVAGIVGLLTNLGEQLSPEQLENLSQVALVEYDFVHPYWLAFDKGPRKDYFVTKIDGTQEYYWTEERIEEMKMRYGNITLIAVPLSQSQGRKVDTGWLL